jgi:hypothetical protein
MDCRFPPPLTDDELIAALDGDAAIQHHLAQCPDCAARLAKLRRTEQRFKQTLFRWDCPPSQELGDYHFRLVSPDREQSIADHLKNCVRCQDELAEMSRFLEAEAPPIQSRVAPEQSRSRRRDWVAQLLPPSLAPAIRGDSSGPIVAQAGEVTLFLVVEPSAQGPVLTGQLAAEDVHLWVGALVEIRQHKMLQSIAFIDEWGSFRSIGFRSDSTDLRIIARTGQAIVVNTIEFPEQAS